MVYARLKVRLTGTFPRKEDEVFCRIDLLRSSQYPIYLVATCRATADVRQRWNVSNRTKIVRGYLCVKFHFLYYTDIYVPQFLCVVVMQNITFLKKTSGLKIWIVEIIWETSQ